jgi:hypothetical protein
MAFAKGSTRSVGLMGTGRSCTAFARSQGEFLNQNKQMENDSLLIVSGVIVACVLASDGRETKFAHA